MVLISQHLECVLRETASYIRLGERLPRKQMNMQSEEGSFNFYIHHLVITTHILFQEHSQRKAPFSASNLLFPTSGFPRACSTRVMPCLVCVDEEKVTVTLAQGERVNLCLPDKGMCPSVSIYVRRCVRSVQLLQLRLCTCSLNRTDCSTGVTACCLFTGRKRHFAHR